MVYRCLPSSLLTGRYPEVGRFEVTGTSTSSGIAPPFENPSPSGIVRSNCVMCRLVPVQMQDARLVSVCHVRTCGEASLCVLLPSFAHTFARGNGESRPDPVRDSKDCRLNCLRKLTMRKTLRRVE